MSEPSNPHVPGSASASPSPARSDHSSSKRSLQRCGSLFEAIAAFLVLMLAALIGYEVIARYVFSKPTGFANQIAAYAMPVIAFFAAGATLGKKAHVAVDAFVNLLSERSKERLALVTELLSLAIIAIVAWISVLEVMDNMETGTRAFSTVFTFPEYIPQIAMPVGLVILTFYQVGEVRNAWRALTSNHNKLGHHQGDAQ